MIDKKTIKTAGARTLRNFSRVIPIILGVFLLLSLINAAIPQSFYANIFTHNSSLDAVIGTVLGSILVGNPLTSYIIGGEFLNEGVSMVAVTAFILSWVTVGLVQLPAESLILGKRFAIVRNGISFILAIIVALLTVFTLGLIQ